MKRRRVNRGNNCAEKYVINLDALLGTLEQQQGDGEEAEEENGS